MLRRPGATAPEADRASSPGSGSRLTHWQRNATRRGGTGSLRRGLPSLSDCGCSAAAGACPYARRRVGGGRPRGGGRLVMDGASARDLVCAAGVGVLAEPATGHAWQERLRITDWYAIENGDAEPSPLSTSTRTAATILRESGECPVSTASRYRCASRWEARSESIRLATDTRTLSIWWIEASGQLCWPRP